VIDEDVLAVGDRVQRLLKSHALSINVLLERIRVFLPRPSLNWLTRVNWWLAYKFRQGRDFGRVQDLLDRLGRCAGGHYGQWLCAITGG